MLKNQFQTIVALCFLAFSCQQKPDNTPTDSKESFNYGSKNDSALAYFNRGWLQIMDNGQWTLAEKSFRKAVEIDPDFRKFVHRHPVESYIKAEYVEVLHANLGADQAIDSLEDLASSDQKELPFFIGYKATMLAETGRFKPALSSARKLKEFVNDPAMPAPYVVFAAVYSSMDSLAEAKKYIDKAVALDPNHLIAVSLKKELDGKIISEQVSEDKKIN